MRKTLLVSACAAVIGLSAVGAASAQTAGAPPNNQTSATGATPTDQGAMSAMNKMKKKSKKKEMKGDMKSDSGAMEKK
jgi:hypothetical protein